MVKKKALIFSVDSLTDVLANPYDHLCKVPTGIAQGVTSTAKFFGNVGKAAQVLAEFMQDLDYFPDQAIKKLCVLSEKIAHVMQKRAPLVAASLQKFSIETLDVLIDDIAHPKKSRQRIKKQQEAAYRYIDSIADWLDEKSKTEVTQEITKFGSECFFVGKGIQLIGKSFQLCSKLSKCTNIGLNQKLAELTTKIKNVASKFGKKPASFTQTTEGLMFAMEGATSSIVSGPVTEVVADVAAEVIEIPTALKANMWLAEARKTEIVRGIRQLKEATRGAKVFECVHDLDCARIFKKIGDRCEIVCEECLGKLSKDCSHIKEINWDQNSVKHILGIDRGANGKIYGFHIDHNLQGVRKGVIAFDKIAIDPVSQLTVLRIQKADGTFRYKSLFPSYMNSDDAFKEILQFVNNGLKKFVELQGNRVLIEGVSSGSMKLKMVLEETCKIVTVYPYLPDEYYATLHFVDILELFS